MAMGTVLRGQGRRLTGSPQKVGNIMQKKSRVGLGALLLGAIALAVWLLWRPAPPAPGVLEVNGRIEGGQAAVGAKIGGKVVRLAVREGDTLAADALIAAQASDQV